MPTVDVISTTGDKVGQLELSDAVFAAPVKEHLLWEVVVAQRADRRQGTASSKSRSQVKGSSRKLYRQKGTGRARHGSIRASSYVGGGIAHGPKPRKYAQRTPKKVRRGALISALSLRHRESRLLVLDSFAMEEIKTKRVAETLSTLGIERGLIVDGRDNYQLARSVRNLRNAQYLPPEGLNVYDVLKYDALLLTTEAAKQVEERLSK